MKIQLDSHLNVFPSPSVSIIQQQQLKIKQLLVITQLILYPLKIYLKLILIE